MREFLYGLATDKYKGLIPGLLKVFLSFLSFIYDLIVRGLIFFYQLNPYRLNCKVISVGNITLGGTGKTSLVEFIARYLKKEGHKVAILSRGYKKPNGIGRAGETEFQILGDEPCMLRNALKDTPVLVDPDRIRSSGLAIRNYGADTVVLDDGFQQWKINKDLEIVTIDSSNPFGNQHLLPRGILREPLSSLKRADIFVFTKTNLNPDIQDIKDFLSSINPHALIIESIHLPLGFYRLNKRDELLGTEALRGETVSLICGIGDPYSFENLMLSLGINIGLSFVFPDHHPYSKKDLENIVRETRKKNIDIIVTTEKDAARLPQLLAYSLQQTIFVLRIELKITKNEQEFHNRLLQLYTF